ncbi:NADPH-dependent oxidoreductase [Propionispira raffinosivorans]|uniref:NADPH-dependent oxidoreductase n=1 Tax=Propionispira raffinosivorans TaxID=86959 RepID=UPI001B7FCECD|nr:NADPH-dependent oxidoreductase [Propionispira raffinosivorans]
MMNNTIKSIKNHRSIRSYLEKDISSEMLEAILEAAQAMPTSINGQQLSVIIVKDKVKKAKIAELTGNQHWIAQAPVFLVFVADFYKTSIAGEKNKMPSLIHESVEGTMVGTFDCGLAMGAAIVAAESMGLGIVPIGAVRKNPEEMIRLLNLPERTFPVAGLVVGYPENNSAQKPRFPLHVFAHNETYQAKDMKQAVDDYDILMADYYRKRDSELGNVPKETNWSSQVADAYKQVYFPAVYPALIKQGFTNDK